MPLAHAAEVEQAALQMLAASAPRVGRRVRVEQGKRATKHGGKSGVVTWHGIDQFSKAGRYGDSLTNGMRSALGKYGFRVRIQPDDGEAFFIAADRVEVIAE